MGAVKVIACDLIDEKLEVAKKMGADAVLNVRYASSSVMQGAAEITAYGTAVRMLGDR